MGWRDRYLTKDTTKISEEPAKASPKVRSKSDLKDKKFVHNDEYKQNMAVLMLRLHVERPEIAKKRSESLKGFKQSPETVAKRLATRRANDKFAWSEESREKLRVVNTGIKRGPPSAETAAKISKALTGKKRTTESRKRIAEGAVLRVQRLKEEGRPHPACKAIMTPNGVFSSATEVSRIAGVSLGRVYHWMKKWPKHYYIIKKKAK